MTTPLDGFGVNLADVPLLPKKKRNTHHWKAIATDRLELFEAERAALQAVQAIAEDERALRKATVRRVRFWRLVALGVALFEGLTLAALARGVLR